MEQTHCTFRLGCGEGPVQDRAAETDPPPGSQPRAHAYGLPDSAGKGNASFKHVPQTATSLLPPSVHGSLVMVQGLNTHHQLG